MRYSKRPINLNLQISTSSQVSLSVPSFSDHRVFMRTASFYRIKFRPNVFVKFRGNSPPTLFSSCLSRLKYKSLGGSCLSFKAEPFNTELPVNYEIFNFSLTKRKSISWSVHILVESRTYNWSVSEVWFLFWHKIYDVITRHQHILTHGKSVCVEVI